MDHQDELRARMTSMRRELDQLRLQLQESETIDKPQDRGPSDRHGKDLAQDRQSGQRVDHSVDWPLDLDEYKRYGRQMVLPEIGLQGPLLFYPLHP